MKMLYYTSGMTRRAMIRTPLKRVFIAPIV